MSTEEVNSKFSRGKHSGEISGLGLMTSLIQAVDTLEGDDSF
jgi:hypothetical protein